MRSDRVTTSLVFCFVILTSLNVRVTSAESVTYYLYYVTNSFMDAVKPEAFLFGKYFNGSTKSLFEVVIPILQSQSLASSSGNSSSSLDILTLTEPILKALSGFLSSFNGLTSAAGFDLGSLIAIDNATSSSLSSSFSALTPDSQQILVSYAGYFACIGFGLLYSFIMLCGCVCFKCGRQCGCCGGKISKKPQQPKDSVKRVVVGLIVVVLMGVVVVGVAGSFLAENDFFGLFKSQNSTDTTPVLLNNLQNILNNMSSFVESLNKAITQLKSSSNLQSLQNSLKGAIQSDLSQIRTALNSSVTSTLALVASINNSLSSTLASTTLVSQIAVNLTLEQQSLNSTLQNIAQAALTDLGSCSSCSSIRQEISLLQTGPTFMFPSLTNAISRLQQTQSLLSQISGDVQLPNTLDLQFVTDAVNSSLTSVSELLKSLNISQVVSFAPGSALSGISSPLSSVGSIGSQVAIAISSVLLSIILSYLIGLLIGTCCSSTRSSGITRQKAETCFTTGSCSAFCFAWPLILLVMITFAVGSLVYIEACRDLQKENNSKLFQSIDQVIHAVANSSFGIPSYISLSTVSITDLLFVQCKNGVSLPDVLLQVVNLRSLLAQYVGNNILGDALSSLIPASLTEQLNNYTAALSNAINITSFNATTSQPVTQTNLTRVATDMLTYNLTSESQMLLNVQNTAVSAMTTQLNTIQATINGLQAIIGTNGSLMMNVSALSTSIKSLESGLVAQASQIADQLYGQIADILMQQLKQVSNMTTCQPLYATADGLITTVCVTLLNPFNAMWFTLGWVLVMYFPLIIFGTWLGGLFGRKVLPPEKKGVKEGEKTKGKQPQNSRAIADKPATQQPEGKPSSAKPNTTPSPSSPIPPSGATPIQQQPRPLPRPLPLPTPFSAPYRGINMSPFAPASYNGLYAPLPAYTRLPYAYPRLPPPPTYKPSLTPRVYTPNYRPPHY